MPELAHDGVRERLAGARLLDRYAELDEHVRRRAGVDVPRPAVAVSFDDLRRLGVELVLDLAEDLLDQVLERDDAARSTVLVDDDRKRRALALHVPQDARGITRLGSKERMAEVRPE